MSFVGDTPINELNNPGVGISKADVEYDQRSQSFDQVESEASTGENIDEQRRVFALGIASNLTTDLTTLFDYSQQIVDYITDGQVNNDTK